MEENKKKKEYYYGIDQGFSKFPSFESVPKDYERKVSNDRILGIKKIYKNNKAKGKFTLILWGVRVEKEFQLDDNIKIMPYDNLEDSDHKRSIDKREVQIPSAFEDTIHSYKPDSALIYETEINPIYSSNIHEISLNRYMLKSDIFSISLLLTIIGYRAVYIGSMWFDFDDKDIQAAHKKTGITLGIGTYHYMQMINDYYPFAYNFYPELDCNEASLVIKAFIKMSKKNRDLILSCLYRLRASIVDYYLGQKAIDLSIALETLLGDAGNSEMTHKITTRLVRILGGDNEHRKKNFKTIKKVYEFRSALMHRGEETSFNKNNQDLCDDSIILFSEVLKNIIFKGSIPDLNEVDIYRLD